MINTIKDVVIYPLLGRIGTAAATALVAFGAQQQHADWVALGILGGCSIAFDLLISYARRRWIGNKALAEFFEETRLGGRDG